MRPRLPAVYERLDQGPSRAGGGWTPLFLRKRFLVLILLQIIALFIGVSNLLYQNRQRGYIVYADSSSPSSDIPRSFTTWQTFTYKYSPTIVGIILSLFWGLVDHHVRRIEPFFQLSQPDGASFHHSLALNYVDDFFLFVPYKSARKRHWVVAAAATVTILNTWILVPLFNSLLVVKPTRFRVEATFSLSEELISGSHQNLSPEFMYDSFDTVWLNGSLPKYSTLEYAVSPYEPVSVSKTSPHRYATRSNSAKLWHVDSKVFWANVTCELARGPVKISYSDPSELSGWGKVSFADMPNGTDGAPDATVWVHPEFGLDCVTGTLDTHTTKYKHLGKLCQNRTNIFTGSWYSGQNQDVTRPSVIDKNNLLGGLANNVVFCNVLHYQARTRTIFDTGQQKVLTVEVPSHDDWTLMAEEEFNSSDYNALIGADDQAYSKPWRGFPINGVPPSFSRTNGRFGVQGAVLPPLNQGLGLTKTESSQLNLSSFLEVLNHGHRTLLAHAIPYILLAATNTSSSSSVMRNGELEFVGEGVVVVESIAFYLMVCLGATFLLVLYIMVANASRNNNLRSDPGSIGALMALTADSPELLSRFRGLEEASSSTIEERHEYSNARLQLLNYHNEYKIKVAERPPNQSSRRRKPVIPNRTPEEKLTWELSRPAGAAFALLLISMVTLTVTAFAVAKANNDDILVRQIVYNYIPLGFTQLLEPTWAAILRLLALFQPFAAIKNGPTVVQDSLTASYGTLPPNLLVFKALKQRHTGFAFLSLLPLISNAVSIAAGALFTPTEVQVATPLKLSNVLYEPLFQPTYTDPFGRDVAEPSLDLTTFEPWDDFETTQSHLNNTDLHTQHYSFPIVFERFSKAIYDHFNAFRSFLMGHTPPWVKDDHFFLPFEITGRNVAPASGSSLTFSFVSETTGYRAGLDCKEINITFSANPSNIPGDENEVESSGSVLDYAISFRRNFPGFGQVPLGLSSTFDYGYGASFGVVSLNFSGPKDNETWSSLSRGSINVPIDRGTYRAFWTPLLAAMLNRTGLANNNDNEGLGPGYGTPKDVPSGPAVPENHALNYWRTRQQFAQGTLMAIWLKFNVSESDNDVNQIGMEKPHGVDNVRDIDSHVLTCTQKLESATFKVKVDNSSRILEYQATSPYSDVYLAAPGRAFTNSTDVARFQSSMAPLFQFNPNLDFGPRGSSEPLTFNWFTYLWALMANSTGDGRPGDPRYLENLQAESPLADASTLMELYSGFYRRIMPIILQQNVDTIFRHATASDSEPATLLVTRQRMQMSPALAATVVGLLCVNLFAVMLLYCSNAGVRSRLPRKPTTLQNLIAYFYDSSALGDVRGTAAMTPPEREKVLEAKACMYSYGRGFSTSVGRETYGIQGHKLA